MKTRSTELPKIPVVSILSSQKLQGTYSRMEVKGFGRIRYAYSFVRELANDPVLREASYDRSPPHIPKHVELDVLGTVVLQIFWYGPSS
ncbi:hypothetical protein D8674_025268 [Pyrus ussuriensis x Pyrus communis]|uniref:Uncharacterized protein n=1 Tax=Pyrus ussuriensis x Pyrus communis TaxID=2448454 RepID=A0A5N5H563_9ROSA|nr:hypothetical protein D8674_025268 [Pyrus ussuriensis x Pyrus communis]